MNDEESKELYQYFNLNENIQPLSKKGIEKLIYLDE